MESSDTSIIHAPCFSCQYCYSCKYWQDNLWIDWILANNECPALKYPLGSIYQAYLLNQKEKKETKNKDNYYHWDEFAKKPK